MTRLETARVNEVIGSRIVAIREAANKLNVDSDLQELEADLSSLEQTIAEFRDSLAGIPYKH